MALLGSTTYGDGIKSTETSLGALPGGVNYGGVFDLARRLMYRPPRQPVYPYQPQSRGGLVAANQGRPMAAPSMAGGLTGRQTGSRPAEGYVPLFTDAIPGMYGSPGGYTSPSVNRGGLNSVAAGWAPASMAGEYGRPNNAALVPGDDGQSLDAILRLLKSNQYSGAR